MKNHNVYNGGIADVWYSGNKKDLWIEYKFVNIPKRDDTPIDLISGKTPSVSRLQQHWLASRHREGRHVGLLVGSSAGGVWFPGISWGAPLTAGLFRSRIQTRASLASCIRGLVS